MQNTNNHINSSDESYSEETNQSQLSNYSEWSVDSFNGDIIRENTDDIFSDISGNCSDSDSFSDSFDTITNDIFSNSNYECDFNETSIEQLNCASQMKSSKNFSDDLEEVKSENLLSVEEKSNNCNNTDITTITTVTTTEENSNNIIPDITEYVDKKILEISNYMQEQINMINSSYMEIMNEIKTENSKYIRLVKEVSNISNTVNEIQKRLC